MDGIESRGRSPMTDEAEAREATEDYSTASEAVAGAMRPVGKRLRVPRPEVGSVRLAMLSLTVVGVVLMIVAEFTTLYEIKVVTAVPSGGSERAGSHHGYALLVIGLFAGVLAYGAARGGSRPAALALLFLGVGALFVCLAIDLPDVDETGLIGERYDQAEARPQAGFYLETAGAVLLLVGGAGMCLFRAPRPGVSLSSGSGGED